ncbi:MAG: hypothetical protein CM15mP130_1260 [Verrucomicrobiota bacterium]|nr:MAG: hypothetical protein CM15mP130_1260 [Verrucomicrobiota bacterium]
MKSKYFSEFLGTAFLFCTVVGSGIMGQNLSSNDSLTLLANTLATVFALYFLITIFGDHSSHFNPVVSMVMLVRKEITTQVCTVFIILQISGAILGVMLANYIFELDPVLFSEKPRSGTHLFVSEILATFGLLMVILFVIEGKGGCNGGSYMGQLIGLLPRLPLPIRRERSADPFPIPLPEFPPMIFYTFVWPKL